MFHPVSERLSGRRFLPTKPINYAWLGEKPHPLGQGTCQCLLRMRGAVIEGAGAGGE